MSGFSVVLDFDGLFLDTEWCEYRTVADVFTAHGTELSLDLWLTFIGTTDHPHWADVLEGQLGHAIDRPEWVPARRLAAVEVEEGARRLSLREPLEALAQHPRLPEDTRLWAALQQVGGGTWGGCVYDTEAILERLQNRGA